ncbi:MAG: LiaF transmembrane domain-containing protein [Syntrophothermus sp.]
MKTKAIFWGVFLITLGGLITLNNVIDMSWHWDAVWNFWPVILIMFGLHFIYRDSSFRWVFSAVNAIVMSLLIFAGYKSMTMIYDDENFENGYNVESMNTPYKDSIKKARFTMEAAAGNFTLRDTTSADLVSAKAQGAFSNFDLQNDEDGENADVSLTMEDQHVNFGWRFPKNRMDLKLNNRPAWEFDLNVGAAKVDLDLAPYNTSNLFVKSGASYVKIRLGDKAEKTDVRFESGVSSLDIFIPKTSGCEINSQLKLTNRNFYGFNKAGNGVYRTENFNDAQKKIYIDFDGAMSSVKVNRY